MSRSDIILILPEDERRARNQVLRVLSTRIRSLASVYCLSCFVNVIKLDDFDEPEYIFDQDIRTQFQLVEKLSISTSSPQIRLVANLYPVLSVIAVQFHS
jgi:hypothetical protein